MNLVAKEYVASRIDNDGVLLLSPFAGAVDQLGESALEFDPYDTANATDALARAVENE
jgi:trehalose 6-phosphate synthase